MTNKAVFDDRGPRANGTFFLSNVEAETAVCIRHAPQAISSLASGAGSGRGGAPCCLRCCLSGLPIPGKQLVDFLCRMIGQFGEHEGEPGLRIDVV